MIVCACVIIRKLITIFVLFFNLSRTHCHPTIIYNSDHWWVTYLTREIYGLFLRIEGAYCWTLVNTHSPIMRISLFLILWELYNIYRYIVCRSWLPSRIHFEFRLDSPSWLSIGATVLSHRLVKLRPDYPWHRFDFITKSQLLLIIGNNKK